jgi:hypothetical protein
MGLVGAGSQITLPSPDGTPCTLYNAERRDLRFPVWNIATCLLVYCILERMVDGYDK